MQKRRILPILHDKNFINIGYYIDIHSYNHHEAAEYAIEISKLKFDYLKQIVHI